MLAGDLESNNTVVRHVWDVLKWFESVLAALDEAPVRLKSKLPPGALRDELGRFRVWSGNIGAHKAGRGSLDHKLREASHIRDSIIETLQIAAETLGTVRSILSEERVPWEDTQYPETDSDEGISDVEDESSTPQTELRQLVGNLVNITTLLLRLSVSIRNPAPHDRFKGLRNIDCRHFEPNDIEHVRAKFPKAADYVSIRLGRAISRRRQFLRYREEHRKNYGLGLEEIVAAGPSGISIHDEVASRNAIGTDEQSTVASSIPNAYKERFPDTTYEGMEDSEDVLSQTSYALSNSDSTMLRPPTLPESGLNDQPFECPLCFQMISVSGTLSWYRHVYRDLQPYVCTFERCNIPDHSYGSRNEWFEHELQNHRNQWQCPGECSEYFSSSADLQTHIDAEHDDLATDARLSDIMAACQTRAPTQGATQCTLCMQPFSSLIALRRHLGKHHEELSLFAVPSHVFGELQESANGSQDGEGSQSSKDGTNSDIAVIGYEVCPECDHIFKGSLDQRRLDLQRHLSEQHSPNAGANPLGNTEIREERDFDRGLSSHFTDSGGPVAHWAMRIFDGRHPSTPFQTLGDATECLGRDEPSVIEMLGDDHFQKVLELPLEATNVWLRLYCRDEDLRARILFLTMDSDGTRRRYCFPLTGLKIINVGSCLELCRRNRKDGRLDLWARLRFPWYERMILFYNTCVAMKHQDHAGMADGLEDVFDQGGTERIEFSSEISDARFVHHLRVYSNVDSGVVRFEATPRRGPLKAVPIWTAFVTHFVGDRSWAKKVGSSTVVFRQLHPYVFCEGFKVPKAANGRYQLTFSSSQDASELIEMFHRIRVRQ